MVFVSQNRLVLACLVPVPTTPGKETPKACKFEHFEEATPMDDQPSNVNQWDELDKWVRFPPQDGPPGDLGTDSGEYGLTDQLGDAWKSVLESESKCMAVISSKILAAPRYTLT